jgi:hypothetical protein
MMADGSLPYTMVGHVRLIRVDILKSIVLNGMPEAAA